MKPHDYTIILLTLLTITENIVLTIFFYNHKHGYPFIVTAIMSIGITLSYYIYKMIQALK